MSTYGKMVTTKVNRVISGATTVTANSYAHVTYRCTSYAITLGSRAYIGQPNFTRVFGPGQSIPNTFTVATVDPATGDTAILTYTLQSGIEIINTP